MKFLLVLTVFLFSVFLTFAKIHKIKPECHACLTKSKLCIRQCPKIIFKEDSDICYTECKKTTRNCLTENNC